MNALRGWLRNLSLDHPVLTAGVCVVGCVGAAVGVVAWYTERRRAHIREEQVTLARSKGIHLAHTRLGRTRYELRGPDAGPLVVFVHGAVTHSEVWEPMAQRLCDEDNVGALTFDMFGRGLSDPVPRGLAANDVLFAAQLSELLHRVLGAEPHGTSKLTLVGHSLGAAVAAGFARRHPNLVEKLVLVSPVGMGSDHCGHWTLRIPVLGTLLACWLGTMYVHKWTQSELPVSGDSMNSNAHAREVVYDSLAWQEEHTIDYMRSLRKTLREFPRDLTETYRELGTRDLPVLMIWGTADALTPLEDARLFQEAMPQAKLLTVEGAGHYVMLQREATVSKAIATFVKGEETH